MTSQSWMRFFQRDAGPLGAAVALWLATAPLPAAAAGPQQQVWLIDTSAAQCAGGLEAGFQQIAFWQLDPQDPCRWRRTDAEALGRSDPLPTVIFLPGYNTGPDAAIQEANALRCDLEREAAGRPLRLVIWAWPSQRDRQSRLRQDVQMKACECGAEGYFLARTLSRLPAGAPLGLVGYSYGARIACGALALLGGSPSAGASLPQEARAAWTAVPRPVRVLFVAAAMDADSLACGENCLATVQRAAATVDCRDRVLRLYTRLYGRGGPPALGGVGPIAEPSGKLRLIDVSCAVGKKHDWYRYESAVTQTLAWYAFLAGE
jgi:hypothetical protein